MLSRVTTCHPSARNLAARVWPPRVFRFMFIIVFGFRRLLPPSSVVRILALDPYRLVFLSAGKVYIGDLLYPIGVLRVYSQWTSFGIISFRSRYSVPIDRHSDTDFLVFQRTAEGLSDLLRSGIGIKEGLFRCSVTSTIHSYERFLSVTFRLYVAMTSRTLISVTFSANPQRTSSRKTMQT